MKSFILEETQTSFTGCLVDKRKVKTDALTLLKTTIRMWILSEFYAFVSQSQVLLAIFILV